MHGRTIPRRRRPVPSTDDPGPADAASLLRSIGLLADGRPVWGRPVPASGPGCVRRRAARPAGDRAARADADRQVDRARRDAPARRRATDVEGARRAPRRRSGCRRRRSLYVGASEQSSAGGSRRIARTELGDRRPHAGGHWLHTLRSLDGAPGLVGADRRARGVRGRVLRRVRRRASRTRTWPACPIATVVLPLANLGRPTGERKATGLTGSLLPEPVAPPRAGDAGRRRSPTATPTVPAANRPPPQPRGRRPPRAAPGDRRRAPRARGRAGAAVGAHRPPSEPAAATAGPPALTAEGDARLRAELDELTASSGPRSSPASGPPRSTATSRRTPSTTPRARSSRSSRAASRRSRPACGGGHRRRAGRRLAGRARLAW